MKSKNSKVTLESLDKKVNLLVKTVDKLAEATARGFELTASKEELRERPTRSEMETIMSKHVGSFRDDYDSLATRVRRLERVVGLNK